MQLDHAVKTEAIACARGIVEWLCRSQAPLRYDNPSSGVFPWIIRENGAEDIANNWNVAFASMGMLAAFRAFGDAVYERAALGMGRYMKSLQIFDPFKPDYYGAFREMSPQCPWNYTRDTLSVAWSFLELFRHTQDEEYLERARLFGQWFLAHGLDDDGWPLWGHEFEPYFDFRRVQMRNDVQGSFQVGSLNFLYRLWQETKDEAWIGKSFVDMADFAITHIQQEDGFYHTILRESKDVPPDPQGGLHRTNDDLGSLGLLCAYRVTGEQKYLDSVQKYADACMGSIAEDGTMEKSLSGIPVFLNLLHEGSEDIRIDLPAETAVKMLRVLIRHQSDGAKNPRMRGGIYEEVGDNYVCARVSCYALIVLLKLCRGIGGYLSLHPVGPER